MIRYRIMKANHGSPLSDPLRLWEVYSLTMDGEIIRLLAQESTWSAACGFVRLDDRYRQVVPGGAL